MQGLVDESQLLSRGGKAVYRKELIGRREANWLHVGEEEPRASRASIEYWECPNCPFSHLFHIDKVLCSTYAN